MLALEFPVRFRFLKFRFRFFFKGKFDFSGFFGFFGFHDFYVKTIVYSVFTALCTEKTIDCLGVFYVKAKEKVILRRFLNRSFFSECNLGFLALSDSTEVSYR